MAVHPTLASDAAAGTRSGSPASHAWLRPTALVVPVVAAALMLSTLPATLLLPALSIATTVAGFALAAALYLTGHRLDRDAPLAWQVAAVLIFMGFGAAMLTDTGAALAALDGLLAGPATAASN